MLIVFHWRILMEIIVLLIQNYLYGLYNYFKMNVGSFTVKNNLPVKFSDQFFSSMLNSTSTIFTMDIYKPYINREASQTKLVNVGRLTAGIALIIAVCLAPLLGGIDQMFQYIQEYTGLVSPGILAVFLMGLFWKKATNKGAIWGVLCSIPIALIFKLLPLEMPFMDQMFYATLLTIVVIFMVSLSSNPADDDPKAIKLTADMFKTDKVFNICAYIICILLVVIYTAFF